MLIGLGHLVRCLSLAKMLKNDFDISFLLSEPEPRIVNLVETEGFQVNILKQNDLQIDESLTSADIIVLDGYSFTSEYEHAIKKKNKALVCIDDTHNHHFYADVIVNVSDAALSSDYSAESYTKFLLGSKYALLRDVFIEKSNGIARSVKSADSVFISMGGADQDNISLKVVRAISPIRSIKSVHVMLGAVNPHEQTINKYIAKNSLPFQIHLHKNIGAAELCSVLAQCQVIICPASGISMEAAAVGVGMLSGYTADNQLGILRGLKEKGCAMDMGDFTKRTETEITQIVTDFVSDLDGINSMIQKQRQLIDGKSPHRLVEAFKQLTNEN